MFKENIIVIINVHRNSLYVHTVRTIQQPCACVAYTHTCCTYLVPSEVVDNARQKCIPPNADSYIGDWFSEPREYAFWNKGAGITKTPI